MSTPINLPGLGVIRPDGEGYRTDKPLDVKAVRDLIRQKWVLSVQVSDGLGGAAAFHAECELNGRSFSVSGEIGSC